MDRIDLLVHIMTWGVLVNQGPHASPTGHSQYANLIELFRERYPGVDLSLIEAEPTSKARKAVLEEDLRKTDIAQDPEVIDLVQSMLTEIEAVTRKGPLISGIVIEDVSAASLALKDIVASGEGRTSAVQIAHSQIRGPITISEVRSKGGGSARSDARDLPVDPIKSSALPTVNLADVEAKGPIEIEVAGTIVKQQIVYPGLSEQLMATRVKLVAVLFSEPHIREIYCKKFFGRDELVREVADRLVTHKEVLLCGMGGVGKTALAAALGDTTIAAGNGPVVWLHCGNESAEVLFAAFERLACELGQPQKALQLRSLDGEGRAHALGSFLTRDLRAGLVVLDDMRNVSAARSLLRGIPDELPTLITSRIRIPVDEMMEVGELRPHAALQMLSYHADRDLMNSSSARELCRRLGYHAYALEIAGCQLKVDADDPEDFLRRITRAPDEATMPESYAEPGRESVRALLADSYQGLDEAAKAIFLTFGVLPSTGATAEFLAAVSQRTLETVKDALRMLARRSLARRHEQSSYYVLHDLTFSYACALAREAGLDRSMIITGARKYLEKHAKDFALLEYDEPNLLGSAGIAEDEDLVVIMTYLIIGGYPEPNLPSFFDCSGHTTEFLERADGAIETLQRIRPENYLSLHYLLGKRGNAYFDRGDYDNAFSMYQAAEQIAPNSNRKIIAWGAMGRARAAQGRYDEAEDCFREGYDLGQAHRDDRALAFILEQRTGAAGWHGDFEAALGFAGEAAEVNERLGNSEALGFAWLNLGSAELGLGAKKATTWHRKALEIATSQGIEELRAAALQSLGEDLLVQNSYDQALEYLAQALALYRNLGKTEAATAVQALLDRSGYPKT